MTRLARGRKTHLSRDEIAAEALRQFDHDQEPSIRGLASALAVAPSAIYHHFVSRGAIVDAALALVWQEAGEEGLRLVEGKLDDPTDLLVAAALATRRAFGHHHQIAPFVITTPEANQRLSAEIAAALAGLGLSGAEADRAFHAYGSFVVGSTLILASRLNRGETPPRDEELFADGLRRLIASFIPS